jgi:hypothetical protein
LGENINAADAAAGMNNTAEVEAKLKKFDTFCIAATKIEREYNEANGNMIQLEMDIQNAVLMLQKQKEFNLAAELKNLNKLYSLSYNPFVLEKNADNEAYGAKLSALVSKGKNVTTEETLPVLEEGAEIVRRIFHKYVVEGKGSTTIARELREEGYHSPNKTGWTNVVILRALRNEKYRGDLVQKKTITPDYLSHKKVVNDGKEPFIIIHDHHEPIISKELFARAQKELEKRSLTQENRRKLGRRYCFSGKITCGECGRSYVFHNKKRNNGSRYHFWECYNKKIYGKTKRLHEEKDEIVGCDNMPISDKDLRTLVSTIISELEFDEENVLRKMKKQLIQAFSEGTKIEYDAEKKKLAIIKDRRKKLVDIYIDHVITKEEFKERCEILDKEISLMENKVRELEKFKTEKGLVENERDAIIKECISYAKDTISCNVVADEFIEAILDEIIIYKNNTIIVKLNLIPDEWKIVVQLGKKMNKNPSEDAKRSVSATDVPISVKRPFNSG